MWKIKRFSHLQTCRRNSLLALILMMLTNASANPVDVNEAMTIAQNFLQDGMRKNHSTKRGSFAKSRELSLALMVTDAENLMVKDNRVVSVNDNALLYVFNGIDNDCFVIVSGESNGKQIFAYSTTNAFRTDSLIPEAKVLLERYKAAVKASRTGASQKNSSEPSTFRAPAVVVEPLIKTQWSQEYPYNYQCPQIGSKRCVVGCTNTAYAQVMNYWQWPKQPTGKVQWSSVAGDQLKMNLSEKPFDWDAMKKTYLPTDVLTDREIDAISYLMAGVGLANGAWFFMNFDSGCTTTPFENTALIKNFQYHCTEVLTHRKIDDAQWLQYIKTELDASRPILYSVARINHAVVVDGYDDGDNVHVNFGWNGDSDGFYSIDGFDNEFYHIDGDDHSYHNDVMIIHIQPNYDGSEEDVMPLYATNGFVKSAYWKFGSTEYDYSVEDKCWKEELTGNEYTPLSIKSGSEVYFRIETDYYDSWYNSSDNTSVDSLGICSFNEDGTVKKVWDTQGVSYGGTSQPLQILNFSNEPELHTITLAYRQNGVWRKYSDFPSISFYVEPLPPLGSDIVNATSEQKLYAYSVDGAHIRVNLKRVDKEKIFCGDVDVQLYKGDEKVRSWLYNDILVPDMTRPDESDNDYTSILMWWGGKHLPPGNYDIKVAVRDYGKEEFRYVGISDDWGVNPKLIVTTENIPGYEREGGLYITDFRVEGAEHGTYHCWMADDNSYYVKDINNIPISLTLYNSSDKDILGDSILLGNASGWKTVSSQLINVKAKESVTLKFIGEFSNPSLRETYFIQYKRYIPWNGNWVEEQIYDNPYVEYPNISCLGIYNNDEANALEQLNDDPVINNGNGLRYGTNNIFLPSDTKIVSYHDTYLKDATGKIVAQTNWWLGESSGNKILRLDIRDDVPPGDYFISINKSADGSGWTLSNPIKDKTGLPLNYPVTLKKNGNIELISDHKNNGVNYSFASGAVLVRGKAMPVRYCLSNPNIGTDYEGTIAVFDDIGNQLSDDIVVRIKKKCAEKVCGEILVTVPADYDRNIIRIYLKEKDSGQTVYDHVARGSGYYNSLYEYIPGEQAVVQVKDKYVLVRAKSYNLKVGDELPRISYDCFGLDEGVTPVWNTEPQISCSITATNVVGTYPVSITAGIPSNISVDAYEGGVIEVSKHILYASVEDQVITYGDEFNVDNVPVKYEGFAGGDDESCLTERPKAVLNNINPDPNDITSCQIELSGGKSDKYKIFTIDGYLTVNKADHEIIWNQNFESVKSGTVVKLNAYATSGNPLEYTTSNPDIAYIYTASDYWDIHDMVLHKEQYLVLRDKGEVVITAYMASTKTTSGTDFYKDRYNEAYKPVSKAINILSGDDNKDDSGSGINEIHFGSHIDVYDLRGNKVRSNTTDLNGLQKGIYIVGGKKVVR